MRTVLTACNGARRPAMLDGVPQAGRESWSTCQRGVGRALASRDRMLKDGKGVPRRPCGVPFGSDVDQEGSFIAVLVLTRRCPALSSTSSKKAPEEKPGHLSKRASERSISGMSPHFHA